MFAASRTGFLLRRSCSATSRSPAVMPSVMETRNTMTSASSIATRAWWLTSSCIWRGLYSCISSVRRSVSRWPVTKSSPPVSTSVNSTPFQTVSVYSRSRVVPGWSSTMASRWPMMRLKSVDLPTLGRPTMATIGLVMNVV